MAISVNTNVGSLTAQRAASSVNSSMETSMERLSSGKRINAAKDDAAGVAIASRLTAEVRGTNQAIRNALDGQALIDTAEGAHEEIVNLLQRMREVSVQGANGTNNAADKTSLVQELTALAEEIDRIAKVTTWAGTAIGMAATATHKFQIGSQTTANNQISATVKTMTAAALCMVTANLKVTTMTNALTAIGKIDTAISTVNTQRAKLGSYSNRLDSAVTNLTNISTNLAAGLGRVQDADFATETTNLARTQILQQAAMAMLAQANASKQGVLSLLQR